MGRGVDSTYVKTFRFDATVLDPPGLPEEAQKRFESACKIAVPKTFASERTTKGT